MVLFTQLNYIMIHGRQNVKLLPIILFGTEVYTM